MLRIQIQTATFHPRVCLFAFLLLQFNFGPCDFTQMAFAQKIKTEAPQPGWNVKRPFTFTPLYFFWGGVSLGRCSLKDRKFRQNVDAQRVSAHSEVTKIIQEFLFPCKHFYNLLVTLFKWYIIIQVEESRRCTGMLSLLHKRQCLANATITEYVSTV